MRSNGRCGTPVLNREHRRLTLTERYQHPSFSRPVLVTVKEAARLLSVSRSKIYEMIRRGELRRVKIDRCSRIDARSIDAILNSKTARDN